MAFFRPRVSREAENRYLADRPVAELYPERLAAARRAERTLREASAAGRPQEELRALGLEFEDVLTEALRTAEAGLRVALGPGAYEDRIARRKAMAKADGRAWSAEVERLRTMREAHRLHGIARVPRQPAV